MHTLNIIGPDNVTWQDYRALRLEALREEPQAFGASYTDTLDQPDTFWQTRLADASAERTNWLLFARRDGRLIGMVGAFQSPAMHAQQIALVVSVYVTAPERGQSVSRHLMEALLRRLTASPVRRARLTVNTAQTTAVRLYQRLGFVVVDHENVRMGDGKCYDEYIMEKALG